MEELKRMMRQLEQDLEAVRRAYQVAERRFSEIPVARAWQAVAREILLLGPCSTGELRRALASREVSPMPSYEAIGQWQRRGVAKGALGREGTRFYLKAARAPGDQEVRQAG